MAADITKKQREFFENYIKEHPPKDGNDSDLVIFNDERTFMDHKAACSRLMKLFLEGKIK